MNCSACGHENRAGAKFCGACAAPLLEKSTCSGCGSTNPPGQPFCDECGATLPVRPVAAASARKVVTIIFADLAASTALHERLDPESVTRFMESYYRAMRGAVEAHGGTVVKLLGDGVMAAFGVPRVAEDDALCAVRAAVAMQHAFRDLVKPLTPGPSPKLGEGKSAVPPLPVWEWGNGGEGDIGLRVAVNTGEVVVSAGNDDVVGDPVNVAARLQQEARDGDVVIGESTRRLVRELVTLVSLGAVALKGRAETVTAYRVVSLERPAGAATTAFVGRDDEVRRVMAVYDAAVAAPAARLAVILGSPGLGKSRLLEELAYRLGPSADTSAGGLRSAGPQAGGGATVLTAQCEAAGGATFAPIATAVRTWLRRDYESSLSRMGEGEGEGEGDPTAALRTAIEGAIPGDDTERTRITDGIAALLAGTPGLPEETFFVVRRFLTALATTHPVVLAIDDLQWAEPLLLDLVEHLVQWGKDVPLLVLAAARPELRNTRSSLASAGPLVADVVTLGGLDAGAATRLAANVIGAEALPAAVAGRVLATSEGNPLFVAELVRMLVNDGALKREGERWTAAVDLAALDMPPTIHALLAARIERLHPEDRAVLERAAVVGRQFSRTAVAHLLPREITDLDARLEALRRSEVIEPDTGWFLGEPALRFHHGLTRDAAYRRVLKGTRAELHARLADWIEAKVGDAIEHEETLGWHLEQAHQHLRELGPIDAHGRELGERAARYLAAAGRRALARDDVSVAAGLLGRALHALDDANSARADLALDWCEALLAAGDVGHAKAAIDELGRLIEVAPLDTPPREGGYSGRTVVASDAEASPRSSRVGPVFSGAVSRDRLSAWHTCFAGQLAVLTDPQTLQATTDAVAAAADALAAVGDAAGEAKAHLIHAQALSRLGQIGACEAALDKALAAARRAHDRRRSNTVLANAPLAALWGPSPVTRASGRCLDVVRVLRITQGAPAVEAVALRCQAVLEALRGRTEAARRMIGSARHMVEELGITQQLLEADVFIGLIDLLEGDAVAAERSLRTAYDGLRTHGLGIDAARAAAFLGRALLAQGRAAEAEALSHESEALAGDDLQATITWRGVRAEALARRGECAAAIDVARTAVAIAGATDVLLLHADARMVLATVLRAAGRSDEAAVDERRAVELWEAKGATLLAERAGRGPERDLRHARERGHPSRAAEWIPAPAGMTNERTEPVLRHHQALRRRDRPNAATAAYARLVAVMDARDADALPGLFADDMQTIHHPTGRVFDKDGNLRSLRVLLESDRSTFAIDLLATLGNSLSLARNTVSASSMTDGPLEIGAFVVELFVVAEVDDQTRTRHLEFFAPDRLGDAVVRLYECYAELLPDGPERVGAAATARSTAALLGSPDRWPFAPDAEATDHRSVGFGSLHGRDAVLQAIGALLQLSNDFTARMDDVVALQSDALLVRWTTSGTLRIGGGPFERNMLMLWAFGPDGLLTCWEQFEPAHDAEALARFDALGAIEAEEARTAPPSADRFANAASRSFERFARSWEARDWAGVVGTYVPTHRMDDRRRLMRVVVAGDDFFANERMLFDDTASQWRGELLATRGDRLALSRVRFTATVGGSGPMEVEMLDLVEVDVASRRTALVVFDPDDLDAAYAEINERYAVGEAACVAEVATGLRAFIAAVAARDWDGLASVFAVDLVVNDHRPLGWPTLEGPAMLVDTFRSLVDLAPDVQLRIDHLVVSAGGSLAVVRFVGTREGGTFEDLRVVVHGFDGHGKIRCHDIYTVEQLDAARARFEEIGADADGTPVFLDPLRIPPNAATRAIDRWLACIEARDWDALRARCAPIVYDDRRGLIRVTGDCDMAVINSQVIAENGARAARTVLATSGERLALHRILWTTRDGSEVEVLEVIEVDAEDRIVALVAFDPDERRAASIEMFERYVRSDAGRWMPPKGVEFRRALAEHDLVRARAALPDDFYFDDHRRTGAGRLGSADAYVAFLGALFEQLSPDAIIEPLYYVAVGPHGFLAIGHTFGTSSSGGAFESVFVQLGVSRGDRAVGAELFEIEDLDVARARFEALGADRAEEPSKR